jgi:hypothetical protein
MNIACGRAGWARRRVRLIGKSECKIILPIVAFAVLAARFRAAAFFRPCWHQSSRTISARLSRVNWKIGKLVPRQAVGGLW